MLIPKLFTYCNTLIASFKSSLPSYKAFPVITPNILSKYKSFNRITSSIPDIPPEAIN